MTNAKLYKFTKGKVKQKNTIKIMIIQNKVCIPQADTEYIITSHNIYMTCDTCWSIYFTATGSLCHEQHVYHSRPLKSNNIFQKPDNNWHLK